MKKLFLFLTILSNSLFAQTPLTLEEMKAKILQNANNLSEYKQGSVFREVSKELKETADRRVCEYERTYFITFLLVPEQDDGSPFEIYYLTEISDKPITIEICGDLINTETTKTIFLIQPPIPTLKWLGGFNFENSKYFQMDDGLILSESDSEKCLYDLKMPMMFSEIRCENNSGVTDSTTKMPDANLEEVYNEVKELRVSEMYPSGPRSFSSMELSKKFGEILKEWKAPLDHLR